MPDATADSYLATVSLQDLVIYKVPGTAQLIMKECSRTEKSF